MAWKTEQPCSIFLTIHSINTRSKEEQERFLGTQIANAATWDEWHSKMRQQVPGKTLVEMQMIVLVD